MKKLEQKFELYLSKTRKLSARTTKNYLSDFRQFWNWVGNTCKVKTYQKITPNLLKRYRAYLSATDLAKSTVKRRLSTIRIFCQFLLDQNLIDKDPSLGLENPSDTTPEEEKILELITKFRRYLDSAGASSNTVKNYLSDVRSYLKWNINQ